MIKLVHATIDKIPTFQFIVIQACANDTDRVLSWLHGNKRHLFPRRTSISEISIMLIINAYISDNLPCRQIDRGIYFNTLRHMRERLSCILNKHTHTTVLGTEMLVSDKLYLMMCHLSEESSWVKPTSIIMERYVSSAITHTAMKLPVCKQWRHE